MSESGVSAAASQRTPSPPPGGLAALPVSALREGPAPPPPATKVFTKQVEIVTPIAYAYDPDVYLLDLLRGLFEHRCFGGAYITRIARVLRRSDCVLVKSNSSARGVVSVQFEAEVAVHNMWDILVGATVVGVRGMVHCLHVDPETGARTVATVIGRNAAEVLKIDDLVPLRALRAAHTPMQPEASIAAVILTAEGAAPTYRLRGELGGEADRNALRPAYEAVVYELNLRARDLPGKSKNYAWFESLLHHYRGSGRALAGHERVAAWPDGPVWEGPQSPAGAPVIAAGGSVLSAVEIVHRVLAGESVDVTGVWSRPLEVARSSPLVAREPLGAAAVAAAASSDTAAAADTAVAADTAAEDAADAEAPFDSPRIVFAGFLHSIHSFLRAVRQLTEVYSDAARLNAHLLLWAYMRSQQAAVLPRP